MTELSMDDLARMMDEVSDATAKKIDTDAQAWRDTELKRLLKQYEEAPAPVESEGGFPEMLPPPSKSVYPNHEFGTNFVASEEAGGSWSVLGVTSDPDKAVCVGFYLPDDNLGRLDTYKGETYLLVCDKQNALVECAIYKDGNRAKVISA